MGGIADYSGATVLELPLACSASAILQGLDAPRIEIASLRDSGVSRFALEMEALTGALRDPRALAAWFEDRPSDHWAAYIVGLVQRCLADAPAAAAADGRGGFRLLVDSSVPEGKGISSSAALETACMTVIAEHCGVAMSAERMAAACQWVENHVAGAPCGVMDQMTSACGRADRLLRLRCQPAVVEGHLEIPRGYVFVGIDSGLRHAVTGSDYATVRAGAFMGYRMIAEAAGLVAEMEDGVARIDDARWGGYLANLTPAELAGFEGTLPEAMPGAAFLARYGGTTDAVTRVRPDGVYPVRQATRHPVHEQARVERFAELLGALQGDPDAAVEMGELMYAAHDSYGACGLGSEGTDRLVALAREQGAARGVFGAKITGGGSGGTVAILARADALPLVREIATRYSAESGRDAVLFTGSSPGAGETGCLAIGPFTTESGTLS